MRMLLYIVILALLFLAPVKRLDVAKLEPVQTVAIRVENDTVIIETDTKNAGQGKSLSKAVADLEQNTPGVIYMDTAQYVLLTEDATVYAQELTQYLHPSVKVSLWDGQGSVEQASEYLEIRQDLMTLKRWNRDKKQH